MAKAWWVLSLNALGAAASLQDSSVVIVTVPVCITPFSYAANATQMTLPTPTSPASASATFCGHPYTEAGTEYIVSCDATLQGQVIYLPGGMRRRQSYAYEPALAGLTLDQCLQDCNGIPACEAVSLVDGDCSLFSSVQSSVASVGGVVAYNSQRFGGYGSGSSGSSAVSSMSAASTGTSTLAGSRSSTATMAQSSSSLVRSTSLSTGSASSTIQTTASLTPVPATTSSVSLSSSSVSTTLMTAATLSSSMKGPAPMSSSTPMTSSSASSSIASIVSSSDVASTTDTESSIITPPASTTTDTPTDTSTDTSLESSTDSSTSASPTATTISSCDNIDFYAASVTCYDAYDNYFIVQQGKSYLGIIANRESSISFPDCLTQCDMTSGCVAVNYGSGTCDLMTRVLGTQTPEGGSNGQVASRPAGVSTTYTAAPASMPT
ncbi:hypothetical protein LTR48_000445 [Friedmanniomyces endolithicus]|uniref:Apple domain-containing protein n=1 Tax=Rachicladosporium monterosium TaxID=1507873 RepID=A0ABR0LGH8_9PEZI|nr:hypothetical protein LTR29_000464 [Friedmanniomyces endolithicus]KAK1089581.1 hypothetical protein LTR48_000445 [Friedmanniomyces endolithicus]KAK5148412.1 hypothetical protein LTR32_000305 [Rachicladosporium monterosium]